MRRILAAALAYLLLAAPAYACAEESRTFFAMDTAMSLRIWGGDSALADACVARIEQLEALFSTTAEDSEIARLNRYGACELSEPTSELLNFALDICEATGGALDVTLYPVVRAWGFTTGEYRVPDEAELSALLAHVDYRSVQLSAGAASLEPGAMVDLGSVAKGYASDELAELLRAGGVTSALIDLGGNIYCLGGKEDGSDWRIGVRDPFGDRYCAVLTRSDCAIVTSGSYERYFETADGTRYGHIFDPSSGRPVEKRPRIRYSYGRKRRAVRRTFHRPVRYGLRARSGLPVRPERRERHTHAQRRDLSRIARACRLLCSRGRL